MKKKDLDKPLHIKPLQKLNKINIKEDLPVKKSETKSKIHIEEKIIPKTIEKLGKFSIKNPLYTTEELSIGKTKDFELLPLYKPHGVRNFYSKDAGNGHFLIDNLFSELIGEYQRSRARLNLGIGEEYSMTWKNIKGHVHDNPELYTFIIDTLLEYKEKEDTDFSKLFEEFVNEVNYRLFNKVDRIDGKLEGKPTTSLPKMSDVSSRVASTEWVDAKINLNYDPTLKWVELDSNFMFVGDPAKTVTVRWEFNSPVQRIVVNGEDRDPTSTSHTIHDLNASTLIKFSYKVEDKWYHKFLEFTKLYAYYYGVGEKLPSMVKTEKTLVTVDLSQNEYVYLYLPKENARISVDNIYGGFLQLQPILIGDIRYHIYRSVNSGLGKIHINYDQ